MAKKRIAKPGKFAYKPVFTDAEYELMQSYGVGDLLDEIGIIRVMLLRTMDQMNEDREQLTFHDHLNALRAVSCATGRIASLLEIREELFKPYQEMDAKYRQGLKDVYDLLEEFGEKKIGKEKWDKVMEEMMLQEFSNEAVSPKTPKLSRSKRKESH